MVIKAIRGFNDILPGEIEKWQYIEKTAREVYESFGFSEIKIPILEKTELFSRSIGETTDIVEKEMYTFQDRSGDSLTLRPEATASMARAYLEHHLHVRDPVAKLYFIGPMFRHERPQKGRYRQFYQIDVEIFGVAHAMADAEVMVMLMEFFKKVGLNDVELQINTLGCEECRPRYKEELTQFLAKNVSGLCPDCKRRLETNPLRILDCKVETCREVVAGAPLVIEFICNECSGHFERVQEYLKILNTPFVLNPKMVRGLDYYTRTVFEAVSTKLGAQNAVTAGGRYDHLMRDIGGPDIPGIGFAMGIERIVLLVPEEGGMTQFPNLFIAALGEKAQVKAFELANQLHLEGIKTEMDYEGRSLKAQMRRADKLNSRYVLIMGEEELETGRAILRDMDKKIQEEIRLNQVIEEIKRRG
ncbi:MAG: histidine--tRNA ligase [Candidatus Altiarchaeales archaeon WOR_SM1_79]|nr:MAG: histidine--tRNA ligase [Candidatus Altiarchaeales archaeon WOR_SM1_79]